MRIVLIFALLALPGVARGQQDIPYVDGGTHKQQLDLRVPSSRDFPTLVFIHGGSLVEGDRRLEPYNRLCRPFAARGIGCAVISYRLFPTVRWPAPADDAAAAFAWVKRNIARFGGDPKRIVLVGHSSGCLLASLLGSDPKYLARAGLTPADIAGVVAIGCRLNATLDLTGVPEEKVREHFARDLYDGGFGSPEVLNDAVPARHIHATMPPFLVMMAESETEQPPILEDARVFQALAAKLRRPVAIEVIAKRKHMSLLEKMAGGGKDPAFQRIVDFIQSSGSIRK